MVRVLHIAGASKFGGGGVIICQVAVMCQEMGWHVDVLTTDPQFQRELRKRNIGVVDLDVIRREISPHDLLGLWRLWWFLRRNRYDIVHTHTSKGGFIGRLAAWGARIPTIIHTAHGFAFHELSPRRTVRFYAALERIVARICDRVITVSEFHRSWAVALRLADGSKLAAIPNGISVNRVRADEDRESMRRTLGVPANVLMLLTIGRLAEEKGLHDLLHAGELINRDARFDFRIVFAGNGPLSESLAQTAARLGIQDRVIFLGFRDDIGNLLRATDIAVFPSIREGLSISLLEAMAVGKAIVATNIGSNLEATKNGEGAIIVPTMDPTTLAMAIRRLAMDGKRRRVLGERARQIFETNYTEEAMLNAYRAQYLLLLTQRRDHAQSDLPTIHRRATDQMTPLQQEAGL